MAAHRNPSVIRLIAKAKTSYRIRVLLARAEGGTGLFARRRSVKLAATYYDKLAKRKNKT